MGMTIIVVMGMIGVATAITSIIGDGVASVCIMGMIGVVGIRGVIHIMIISRWVGMTIIVFVPVSIIRMLVLLGLEVVGTFVTVCHSVTITIGIIAVVLFGESLFLWSLRV